jgi:hypothetical protein
MPEDRSSRPESALIAWIGAPPPAELGGALPPHTRLHLGLTPRADLLVVRAEAGPEVLRQLPLPAVHPPIIAAAPTDPSTAERMAWIKAGAEDLVSFAALPIAVGRRLKRLARERGGAEEPSRPVSWPRGADEAARAARPPEDAARSPLALTRSLPGGAEKPPRLRSEAPLPSTAPPARPRDEFPALTVPQPASGVDPHVRPWVDALVGYIEQRDAVVGTWREGRLERLLELLHHRERLAASATQAAPPQGRGAGSVSSTFGSPPGPGQPGIVWPVLIRRGPSRGRKGIEVDEGRVLAVGTDGLCLSLPSPAGSRQKMVLDLCADRNNNAQLLVQARWQRRVAADRWVLGVLVLEVRLRAVDEAAG